MMINDAPEPEPARDLADRSAESADARLLRAQSDYEMMAHALAFVGERWRDRPTYVEAAKAAGLSPYHFHRVFTRWAGVSPKRLVDAFAHDAARVALADGATVLEAAFEAELSGPSRLHDLFIAHEATTPGEARRRGAGLRFEWGVAPTPFGSGVFLIAPRGLSALAFADPPGREGEARAMEDLSGRYPGAEMRRDDAAAARWARRIFVDGDQIELALYGTPWQRQVWRALIAIPEGATCTYQDIARTVGSPKAARAVGAAVGANPVSLLVPCHRVLGRDGRLTGYHWGVDRKRAMLAYEQARSEARQAESMKA